MAISFGSINTGLPKDIVKQLVEAERIPIKQMETQKGHLDEKGKLLDQLINTFQELYTFLTENNSARNLRVLKAVFNNEIVDCTVNQETAEPGDYQFSVEQMAQRSSAITTGFEDPDDSYVGVGFIQYTLPDGETRDIYVDSDNASLRSVARLINKDPECRLRATIVNDGSGETNPWRMILTLKDPGDENDAEWPSFYFLDGEDDLYIDDEREALDAVVTLDGFELEVPKNSTSDLINGLTIDFKKAKPGDEFTIRIMEDKEALANKFKEIVDKLNAILKFIRDQNTMDAKTDTKKTLGGDITLQSIESRLRSLIFEPVETRKGTARFGDLGLVFQRDGLLRPDSKQFEAAVSEDFINVQDILVGHLNEDDEFVPGFINKLETFCAGVVQRPNGMLRLSRDTINSKIKQVDRNIENRERIIEKKEKTLKDKFARLEGTISSLKNQGAGLASLSGQQGNFTTDLGGAG